MENGALIELDSSAGETAILRVAAAALAACGGKIAAVQVAPPFAAMLKKYAGFGFSAATVDPMHGELPMIRWNKSVIDNLYLQVVNKF